MTVLACSTDINFSTAPQSHAGGHEEVRQTALSESSARWDSDKRNDLSPG